MAISNPQSSEPRALFEAIYSAWVRRVQKSVRVACGAGFAASDQDDIVQEAFTDLWFALGSTKLAWLTLKNWQLKANLAVVRIILFRAAKFARFRYYRRSTQYTTNCSRLEKPTELLEPGVELWADIERAINSCSAEYRVIINLKRTGATYFEIAQQLNVSEAAVRGRYHRAMILLRKQLRR